MGPIVLDTNVLSEILRPDGRESVADFVESLDEPWVSAVAFHELTYGVELMPLGKRRSRLSSGIDALRKRFKSRTIVIDEAVAALSGRLRAGERRAGFELKPMDALIAACALAASATLATRNTKDFERLGIPLVDPWSSI